ncbi:hypothetical protein FRAAL3833 [Frankia alni ACN14a]|uniref:Uncharacterized protein n=1 Tax=Frankia alni (strain DSM 45986 / CECT 9034 / ACN14a) TaxID=326424 RepID=Q0RJ37_FRAAA|nr:hypothetical protein FRAAL3833 [Frankia alni ACN14a]
MLVRATDAATGGRGRRLEADVSPGGGPPRGAGRAATVRDAPFGRAQGPAMLTTVASAPSRPSRGGPARALAGESDRGGVTQRQGRQRSLLLCPKST